MKKTTGFTLLEMVVVIIIVSILAVIGLPKFLAISDAAKKSSIEAVAAGFTTAVIATRSEWEVDGKGTARELGIKGKWYHHVEYGDVDFWLTDKSAKGFSRYSNGFPVTVKEPNSLYTLKISDADCVLLMDNLLQNPPLVYEMGAEVDNELERVRFLAEADNNVCIYHQQEGEKHSFSYDIRTGRVKVQLR